MNRRHLSYLSLSGVLLSFTSWPLPAGAQTVLPQIVVSPDADSAPRKRTVDRGGQAAPDDTVITPTSRPEPRSRMVGTVQVIDQTQIERSTAKSVTDLLAENAVGFLSEWTPGQTQVVMRGAQTEGQGRDFKSEVLILLNGHRAGTANVSKLSLADVERIEIVRGPSSVVYGSQNMGGIINIILKTGRTAPGVLLEASSGSWGLADGKAQAGGVYKNFDYYFGTSGGTQGSYRVGGGVLQGNSAWQRHGETAAVGWQANETNRFDFNIRQDGIYNAGFRGSSANLFAQDDRFNGSFDLNYNGKLADGRASWFWQVYGVQDIDHINNPGLFSKAVTPNTSLDLNQRIQDLLGSRFQPRFNPWAGNDLLLGWDFEHETLRSSRSTFGLGVPVAQVAPTDNNQTENVNATYFEDAQSFFDDRWILRGGLRQTLGATTLDPTPVVKLQTSTHDYQALTYSAGSSWQVNNWLSTRVGASSGFRAPTATELGQNFTTATTGTVLFGNPALSPERSEQVEAGATATWNSARFDLALFQNRILHRITTQVIGPTGSMLQEVNNPGAVVLQGVELQYQLDMLKLLSRAPTDWHWSVFGNAYYNFHMVDEGSRRSSADCDTNTPLRTYDLKFR